jgi:hypothetical protein
LEKRIKNRKYVFGNLLKEDEASALMMTLQ